MIFSDDRTGINGKGQIVEDIGITRCIDERDELVKAIDDRRAVRSSIERHNGKLIQFTSHENAHNLRSSISWSVNKRPNHVVIANDWNHV